MCFTVLYFCYLPSFCFAKKLQGFHVGNCSLKEPPGPTATFQGTSKNHPEAPKEPQGAPKSSQGATRSSQEHLRAPNNIPRAPGESPRTPKQPPGAPLELPRSTQEPPGTAREPQGAPRDPPGAPKSPSFCPSSSLHQSLRSIQGAGGTGHQPLRFLFSVCTTELPCIVLVPNTWFEKGERRAATAYKHMR